MAWRGRQKPKPPNRLTEPLPAAASQAMAKLLPELERCESAASPGRSEAGAVLNKAGQKLGRKGLETRTRLLAATRALLERAPQTKLNPSKIAREADLASQTFYLYFADVEEALLILCAEAAEDIEPAVAAFNRAGTSGDTDGVYEFVQAYYDFWDRHRAIFALRNYYSDNDEPRFVELRTACSMPVIDAITNRLHISGGITPSQALARAVVIFSAVDRMAARAHVMAAADHRILSNADLMRAEADVLSLILEHPGYHRQIPDLPEAGA